MYKRIGKILLCLILIVSVFLLGHSTTIYHSLEGTYSAGNEPDKNNIHLAIGYKQFELYDQNSILAFGRFERIEVDSNLKIYSLISNENAKIGYILQDKDRIILLNFKGQDIVLKKVSKNPSVIGA